MVLGLVAYRVPRSGMGARRQTGRSPANSSGTVLLPYPRVLLQDVLFSSQLSSPQPMSTGRLAGTRDPGTRGSGTAAPMLPDPSPQLADTYRRTEEPKALRGSWTFGG